MSTPEELRAKLAKQREEIGALKEYFTDLFPEEKYMVPDTQFGIWIRQYGFDHAISAFEEVAKKINTIDQKIEGKVFGTRDGKRIAVEPFNKLSLVKLASWIMARAKEKDGK
jgi:hypothetical protein